jgi:hypothetical protein
MSTKPPQTLCSSLRIQLRENDILGPPIGPSQRTDQAVFAKLGRQPDRQDQWPSDCERKNQENHDEPCDKGVTEEERSDTHGQNQSPVCKKDWKHFVHDARGLATNEKDMRPPPTAKLERKRGF